jgi:hypothetical protein
MRREEQSPNETAFLYNLYTPDYSTPDSPHFAIMRYPNVDINLLPRDV